MMPVVHVGKRVVLWIGDYLGAKSAAGIVFRGGDVGKLNFPLTAVNSYAWVISVSVVLEVTTRDNKNISFNAFKGKLT